MISEQHIKMAAKMYQCRDAAKALYGKEYKKKLDWYICRIYEIQKARAIETLPALIEICSLPSIKENAMATTLFMASAVEIIEPSNS